LFSSCHFFRFSWFFTKFLTWELHGLTLRCEKGDILCSIVSQLFVFFAKKVSHFILFSLEIKYQKLKSKMTNENAKLF